MVVATGVDGGADPGDAALVGDLQAVEGGGRILERGAAGAPVTIGDEVSELGHGWGRSGSYVR